MAAVTVYCVDFQECYSTQGQKHAYAQYDAVNDALAAFYSDEQSMAKRAKLS